MARSIWWKMSYWLRSNGANKIDDQTIGNCDYCCCKDRVSHCEWKRNILVFILFYMHRFIVDVIDSQWASRRLLLFSPNDKCTYTDSQYTYRQDKLPQKNILIEKTWSLRTNDDFNTVVNWYFGMSMRSETSIGINEKIKTTEAINAQSNMLRTIFPIHFEKLSTFILDVDFFRVQIRRLGDLNCQVNMNICGFMKIGIFRLDSLVFFYFHWRSKQQSVAENNQHKPNTHLQKKNVLNMFVFDTVVNFLFGSRFLLEMFLSSSCRNSNKPAPYQYAMSWKDEK